MIIQTRYRDIPWEEAIKCSIAPRSGSKPWWEARRGKPVSILTPGHGDSGSRVCDGPFFNIVGDTAFDDPARVIAVCPHIAEIGD